MVKERRKEGRKVNQIVLEYVQTFWCQLELVLVSDIQKPPDSQILTIQMSETENTIHNKIQYITHLL